MSDIRKLVEDINEFADSMEATPVVDQFDGAELDDSNLATTNNAPLADNNATEVLAAKTKISRAFDVLKDAFNDFQNQIVDSIDLSGDNDILQAVDALTNSVTSLQQAISPEPVADTGLEPVDFQGFDAEIPTETDDLALDNEIEDDELDDFDIDDLGDDEENTDENGLSDDELEKDFDDNAKVDFGDEEDELDKELEADKL